MESNPDQLASARTASLRLASVCRDQSLQYFPAGMEKIPVLDTNQAGCRRWRATRWRWRSVPKIFGVCAKGDGLCRDRSVVRKG